MTLQRLPLLLALALASPAAWAGQSLTIQGRVLDASGNPVNGSSVLFRVKVLTPLDSPWGKGIGFFNVDGLDHGKLGGWLQSNYRVVNTPITHAEFGGIRITPNVYTTLDEVDRFAELVLTAIRKGIA